MGETDINSRIRQLFELKTPENKKYTSKYVSEQTGIGRVSLDNYRKGSQMPSAENVGIIAEFFGVSHRWLLTGKGSMYTSDEVKGNDETIPLSIVRMMHEERMQHYEENKVLLNQIKEMNITIKQQMELIKKMDAHKENDAECADVG